jgi:transposase
LGDRAHDRLLVHKDALSSISWGGSGSFAFDCDLLLYDVTSVYCEEAAEANPLAQLGHSLDHRPDCKRVCLAFMVSREAIPIAYDVFAGNRTNVTTVEDIVEAMEAGEL